MNPLLVILTLSAAAVASVWSAEVIIPDLTFSNVERTIDLTSQLVKINSKLTLENSGGAASSPVKFFLYSVSPNVKDKIAYIGATFGSSNDKTYLRVTETNVVTMRDVRFWKVDLKTPLAPGKSVTVDVEVVLAKSLEMYPAQITQREKQLVLFNENHYSYLPYKSKTQLTRISLPNSNVESYSKLKPVSAASDTLTYGPYSNVEAFSFNEMTIHYENNNPFLIVTKLERLIELSMWGNIAVEETIDVRHSGAVLKGSFSRYEYQRENSGVSSVKSFKTFLPASAVDVYYRDEVGNISTSALKVLEDAVELDLRPRFPLFGGWKTHYTIGYNVPSYEYLYTKGNHFVINMRLLDHVFNDMTVEDFTLKIILPEGCEIGKLHTPYPMVRDPDTLHYTYLDTIGRPVVTIRNSKDLIEKHIQDFQLEFKYPKLSMIREPLLLIATFFIFFSLAIIYVRLDFSISKDESSEAKMKVAGYCEKVSSHQDRRTKCYTQIDEALVKLKSTKDNAAFQNTIKKLNADLKVETNAITELNGTLKSVAPEMGEKISELQRLDKQFREHQMTQAGLVEKLVSGKITKQQFVEQESAIIKKKEECVEKINCIVRAL